MIIALIIAMLFTVSSVCAADSEIQAMGAHNSIDTVSEVNDNNLKMNSADEVLSEPADFADLNETINGNSSKTYIELETDYCGSSNWTNGVQINKDNITIDGKGHTIDCTGQNSRMFDIQKKGITLKNIKFTGGSSDRGGAIYTNKDLTIINCTFKDNQATGTDANTDHDSKYGGGAILGDDVKMSIYNCTFVNNMASSNGGAIAGIGGTPDDWEISQG